MDKIVNIRLKLPLDFSCKLDYHLVKLHESGVRKTKEKLIIELAQIGLLNEKIES